MPVKRPDMNNLPSEAYIGGGGGEVHKVPLTPSKRTYHFHFSNLQSLQKLGRNHFSEKEVGVGGSRKSDYPNL